MDVSQKSVNGTYFFRSKGAILNFQKMRIILYHVRMHALTTLLYIKGE